MRVIDLSDKVLHPKRFLDK